MCFSTLIQNLEATDNGVSNVLDRLFLSFSLRMASGKSWAAHVVTVVFQVGSQNHLKNHLVYSPASCFGLRLQLRGALLFASRPFHACPGLQSAFYPFTVFLLFRFTHSPIHRSFHPSLSHSSRLPASSETKTIGIVRLSCQEALVENEVFGS